jgi:hypothetical protein
MEVIVVSPWYWDERLFSSTTRFANRQAISEGSHGHRTSVSGGSLAYQIRREPLSCVGE